jgi:hypothetical protein
MTLQSFQLALCDCIASPRLCLQMRADPDRVLARYDLSPRERRRLLAVIWQRGMSTNCSLYRNNRITPIYTLLPHTCFLLQDALISEVERFWDSRESTLLQFKREIDLFGAFLRRRLKTGELTHPLLEEILDFELASNALRFLPQRRISDEIDSAPPAQPGAPLRRHPLTAVVRFRHEPGKLLRLLAERSPIPEGLSEGEFYLLLSASGNELEVRNIHPGLGRLLQAIEVGATYSLEPDEASALIGARLAIRG